MELLLKRHARCRAGEFFGGAFAQFVAFIFAGQIETHHGVPRVGKRS